MRKYALLICFVCAFFVSACGTAPKVIGGNPLPSPSAGFTPAASLSYSKDKVYEATMAVLADKGIAVVNENKEGGRVSTDYVAGTTQQMGVVVLGTATTSTRYKYLVNISPDGKKKSRLAVKAFLEASSSNVQSWRDISSENQKIVSDIQNSLIESIESKLKSGK